LHTRSVCRRFVAGTTYVVSLRGRSFVYEIFDELETRIGVDAVTDCTLQRGGKVLELTRTLDSYRIGPDSTVFLVRRVRAGMRRVVAGMRTPPPKRPDELECPGAPAPKRSCAILFGKSFRSFEWLDKPPAAGEVGSSDASGARAKRAQLEVAEAMAELSGA
jgi:hypothetical protein